MNIGEPDLPEGRPGLADEWLASSGRRGFVTRIRRLGNCCRPGPRQQTSTAAPRRPHHTVHTGCKDSARNHHHRSDGSSHWPGRSTPARPQTGTDVSLAGLLEWVANRRDAGNTGFLRTPQAQLRSRASPRWTSQTGAFPLKGELGNAAAVGEPRAHLGRSVRERGTGRVRRCTPPPRAAP